MPRTRTRGVHPVDIHETLEQRRADLRAALGRGENAINRQRSIVAKATEAGRDLSADERRQIDSLATAFERAEADARAIRADIDDLEHTPVPRVTAPNPVASADPATRRRQPARSLGRGDGSAFAGLFGNRLAPDPYGEGTFASFGDFAGAVLVGNDSRLLRNAAITPATTGDGASGGYLVPLQFVQDMMDESLKREVVRPRARVIPISTGQAMAVGFSSTDGTNSKRAGLQLLWAGESTTLTEQKAKAREICIVAKKATVYCTVSAELAADAPNFDRMLTDAMIAAVAAGLDYSFISGTGVGQALGMANAPCTIVVAKESGQSASTVLLQNLAKMLGRLIPSSYRNAVWFINPTVVPLLYQMAYTVKNVAGTENVGGAMVHPIAVGPDGGLRCFGLPMVVTDAAATLSAQGDVILADMTRYLIGMRQDVTLARDTSRYFDSDEVAFKLTMRLDGMPEDNEATKLRDGTNTVSPFVVLGAR